MGAQYLLLLIVGLVFADGASLVDVTIDEIVDSCGPYYTGYGPEKAIDGDTDSFWDSKYIEQYYNNWYITFKLSQRYTVTNVKLLNRGDSLHDVTKFKLEASDDQITWHSGGSVNDVMTGSHVWQGFTGFSASGKYLRINITETDSGIQPWLSELSFTGYAESLVDVTIAEIVDSCGPYYTGYGPEKAIDGDTDSFWYPKFIEQYYNNWYITFKLSQRYTVTNVKLLNRGDSLHDVTKFKLEASDDQITWRSGGSVNDVMTGSHVWQGFTGFSANGKYLRINITETDSGHQPWLSELSFTGYADLSGSGIQHGDEISESPMKLADGRYLSDDRYL
ncbi:unnamed protein product [Meganyctiphanes norvegica]|uniref:F5/8 type C domain-containing protein n=1 Tax=Meganyctiphanes norvegica TaxID=48144 RepID=A0AAV2Q8Q3_MEGNR